MIKKSKNWAFAILLAFCFVLLMSSAAKSAVVYTVKAKDTLWKIAKSHNVSVEAILRANPELDNEQNLKAGTAIMIPEASEDIVPLDSESSGTHTLVIHGSGSQYQTATEKNVNVMTVDGKTVRIPSYRPKTRSPIAANSVNQSADEKAAAYKYKFNNMSSRGATPMGLAIIKSAFRYMGVPYVFGGTTPNGFDCSGFVQYVFRENGVNTPRMAHHQFYAGTPITKDQLRPGDLVFFETYTKGISHVGIYIGNGNFIHASSKGAVRVDDLNAEYYTNRYRGAARY